MEISKAVEDEKPLEMKFEKDESEDQELKEDVEESVSDGE